ncbi:MAG TPA: DsbA family protein [Geminicoccaceae bacterium]|nr:DsbA family protein [Geminicoccus sp.]HMU50253.1 DsbA family protein [Geminicoccaceae bacterium]
MMKATRLAAVGLGLLCGSAAQAADPASALPREEIEKIVREYLMREPEVIYEAIQELQQRRAVAEAERQQQAVTANKAALFSSAEDPIIGNPEGDVALVQFFDYRCGYCRGMVPGLRSLVEKDKGLRIVMKEFPVLGPESTLAAHASLAAAQQGRYAEFHLAMMGSKQLDEEAIMGIASRLGLDVDRLAADMKSESVQRTIDANARLASELGITGTPSFVIGDKLVPGAVDIAQLEGMIAARRQATN